MGQGTLKAAILAFGSYGSCRRIPEEKNIKPRGTVVPLKTLHRHPMSKTIEKKPSDAVRRPYICFMNEKPQVLPCLAPSLGNVQHSGISDVGVFLGDTGPQRGGFPLGVPLVPFFFRQQKWGMPKRDSHVDDATSFHPDSLFHAPSQLSIQRGDLTRLPLA